MKRNYAIVLLLLLLAPVVSKAQLLTIPPNGDNQRCEVTQYLGALASIKVVYYSPDVTGPQGEDRKGHIWGELVPWGLSDLGFGRGMTSPWRAGANENTVVEISHDMEVEGKKLAAGRYGFHLIPSENGPWTAIFSRTSTAWGSYAYDAAEDALRVMVTPRPHVFTEWLSYSFIDRKPDAAVLALQWEELELPIRFSLPNDLELYVNQFRDDLKGGKGFNWIAYNEAAQFCAQNGINLEEALQWADAALSMPFISEVNYTTLSTKAQVLSAMGREQEAADFQKKAIYHPSAQAFQIHQYGRKLLAEGKTEEALDAFRYNEERFDGAWPTHVGMMRGLSAKGDYKGALKHARLALAQAPDPLNKNNLEQSISKLEKGQDVN